MQVEILWPKFDRIGIHEDFFTVRMQSSTGGEAALYFRDAAAWDEFVDSVNTELARKESVQWHS